MPNVTTAHHVSFLWHVWSHKVLWTLNYEKMCVLSLQHALLVKWGSFAGEGRDTEVWLGLYWLMMCFGQVNSLLSVGSVWINHHSLNMLCGRLAVWVSYLFSGAQVGISAKAMMDCFLYAWPAVQRDLPVNNPFLFSYVGLRPKPTFTVDCSHQWVPVMDTTISNQAS